MNGRMTLKRELSRLVLSITTRCNLRCKYCYVFADNVGNSKNLTMRQEILHNAIHKIFNSYSSVKFIQFFGGEPNLALSTMQEAVDKTREVCDNIRLPYPNFGIITNLTILNEEILSFYEDNHLKVTVSLDGPKEIHDSLRIDKSGGQTHAKVVRNLEWISNTGIPFSVECTFTRFHIEKGITVVDLLKYFEKLGAERADIICVMAKPNSELDVYGKHFSKLVQLFVEGVDYWFDYWEQGSRTMFGMLGEILAMLNSPQKKAYCPAGESYLAVSPDGGIYPCHLFIGNSKYMLGKAQDSSTVSGLGFKNQLKCSSLCKNCMFDSCCFTCLGRNAYYYNRLDKPFMNDCILKREMISKVLEKMDEKISTASLDYQAHARGASANPVG